MKDPLGVSPSKGNQGTTPGKEKILLTSVGIETHDLRISSTVTLLTELWGRKEKVGDDKVVNRGEEKVRVHMMIWMLSRVALWTQMVEQRMTTEV